MVQQVTPVPSTFPAADLDRRFYAFALDRLVAWSVVAAAAVAAYLLLIRPGHLTAGLVAVAVTVLAVGLALAVLAGLRGTSPGKAALGLRLVHHGTGTPIGVRPAVVRTFVLGVAGLPTFGLGAATLAWTALADRGGQRRGWHDHLAHSLVVDVRPEPEQVPEVESGPRHIVNLTALRLLPPSAEPAAEPAPAEPAPAAPPGRRMRLGPPLVDRPAAPRQQLGPPLVDHGPAEPPVLPSVRWRVTFDSGESLVVEGLTLVGRRPEPRPGEPVHRLVALRSEDMSLSKTHAQFQVVPDGALVVMDRGSTNGSLLVRGTVPRELTVGRPAALREGDRVHFGDRQMTVEREA